MKILSPIDRTREALLLIKAGSDEFFCGVIINEENLGSVRRSGDAKKYNFPSLAELKKAVDIIKKNKKKIFLVLNHPAINRDRRKIIHENINRLKGLKLDGFIVSDIELINELKNYGVKVIASSIIETKNEETVRFLKKLKVKRVIFDRQITLSDLKDIVSEFPGIEFETFIMSVGCRSLAGYCRRQLITKKSRQHIHLCGTDFSVNMSKNNNFSLSSESEKVISARLKMPVICCGACAFYQFKKYGITSVKIIGRGFSSAEKIQNLKFIRKALNTLEKGYSRDKFYRKMEKLFEKTYHLQCNREFCYYPHFFNE